MALKVKEISELDDIAMSDNCYIPIVSSETGTGKATLKKIRDAVMSQDISIDLDSEEDIDFSYLLEE